MPLDENVFIPMVFSNINRFIVFTEADTLLRLIFQQCISKCLASTAIEFNGLWKFITFKLF